MPQIPLPPPVTVTSVVRHLASCRLSMKRHTRIAVNLGDSNEVMAVVRSTVAGMVATHTSVNEVISLPLESVGEMKT